MTETIAEMRKRHRHELIEALAREIGDASFAWRLANELMPTDTMAECTEAVSKITGHSVEELRGPLRRRSVSFARQMAMWQMKQQGHSLPDIGRYLNRDHTTVLHGIRRVESKMAAAG